MRTSRLLPSLVLPLSLTAQAHAGWDDTPRCAARSKAAGLGAPEDVVAWLDLAGRVAPDPAAAAEVGRMHARLLGDQAPPLPRAPRRTTARVAGRSPQDLDLETR